MSRILFLIDGFNFYHRLKEYQRINNTCVKWLNYRKLMLSFFNGENDKNNSYEFIYFSAYAGHRGQSCVDKHKVYIKALENENIQVVLGKFKPKEISRCSCAEKCHNCKTKQEKTPLIKHEEKNTDVNIAITLVEKALLKEYDSCYILSSDSDFNTAIKRAKYVYPEGKLVLVPPPLPSNSSRKTPYLISNVVKLSGSKPLFVSWNKIINSQFSNTISLPTGAVISNPF